MSQLTIRRFSAQDQASVVNLISSIMNSEFQEDRQAYPLEDLRDIASTYGGVGEAFFVAVNGSHDVIGTVGIKQEDGRVALLRRLFVAESFRKQKLGKNLINEAMKFCDSVGYDEVIFKTTSRMKAASLMCQKCGFVQRAKVQLGAIELIKFSYLLSSGNKKLKS